MYETTIFGEGDGSSVGSRLEKCTIITSTGTELTPIDLTDSPTVTLREESIAGVIIDRLMDQFHHKS